jgi:tetratricopeptide (TPR) repeat protein
VESVILLYKPASGTAGRKRGRVADMRTQAPPLPVAPPAQRRRRSSLTLALIRTLSALWLAFLGYLALGVAQHLGQNAALPLLDALPGVLDWARRQPLLVQVCIGALVLYIVALSIWLTFKAWRVKRAAQAKAAIEQVATEREGFKQALVPTTEIPASVKTDTTLGLAQVGEITRSVETGRLEAEEHARAAEERDTALGQAVNSSADRMIEAVDAGTDRVIEVITGASADFIFAGELDPVTLNMGDTAAATFRYIEDPVADALARAMNTLHARAADPDFPQLGFLVLGAPNAGKTRLAFEALRRRLPNWSVLVWSEAGTDPNAIPPVAAFRDRDLVLFLDDLPKFASAGPSVDVAGRTLAAIANPVASTLQTLCRRAKQHARHLAIVATCRTGPDSEYRLHATLPWLEGLLLPLRLPTFPDRADDPTAARIIAAFASAGSAHTGDWNGTLGSLVLGFREKREQYGALQQDLPAAVSILCAMKLLERSGIAEHTEQRVRAVCAGVFHDTSLRDDGRAWRTARQALVDTEFVRLASASASESASHTDGLSLVMRKDAYFDTIVICYADPRPSAGSSAAFQLSEDRRALLSTLAALGDAPALFDLGNMLHEEVDYSEALAAFDRSLALRPDHPATLGNRGNVLARLGRPEEALAAYDEALRADPHLSAASFSKASLLLALGKPAEALAAFELNFDATDARDWNGKGIALTWLHRYDEAVTAYDEALACNPIDVDIWIRRAYVLNALDRYDEALLAIENALIQRPDDADIWFQKGYTLEALHRYAEAVSAYDQAATRDPNDPVIWRNKAKVLYENLHRYDDALAAIQRATSLDETSIRGWTILGDVQRALGHLDEATAAYERALAIEPSDSLGWFSRGRAFAGLDRHDDALTAFDQSLAVDPNDAAVWRAKGRSLRALGRDVEANAVQARVEEQGG